MKTYFSAIVLFFVITQCGYAQAKASPAEDLSDSSRALQFQIANNFQLTSFQGTVFSYKHHINKEAALRFGLSISFGGSNSDNTTDGFSIPADSLFQHNLGNIDNKNRSFQLSAQLIRYFNPGAKLLLYGGAGPFLLYDYTYAKSESVDKINYQGPTNAPLKTSSENKGSRWSPGIMGVLGVEWFAAKGISLTAEYGMQVSYTWGKTESKSVGYSSINSLTSKQDGWNLGASSVKFGLSLYFL
ncbi:MAG TPA: hypothetical protein VHO43_02160 [Ignavibacteriales bacterium]|nr:hypothetical protein [Ignavibacteriales bacterium]